MKTNKLVVMTGITGLCLSALGGVGVKAAESPATGIGHTEGKIEIVKEEGDEKPVTPTEPPEITIPPKPTVPPVQAGEATLLWYPKLNFGTHKYDESVENVYDAVLTEKDKWTNFPGATQLNGEGQPVDKDGNVIEGVPTFQPALVQVKHTAKAKNWSLKVSLGDFVQNGEPTETLPGAKIQITNSRVVNGLGNAATSKGAGTEGSFTLTPGNDAKGNPLSTPLLSYTKPEDDQVESNSYNSMLFGSVSDTTTNQATLALNEDDGKYKPFVPDPAKGQELKYNKGVELHVPKNRDVAASGYTATLDWTLSCEF